tara:strand:+ start:2990 stop:3130 length:141 start_codon:yes stop_codon:yes gene_type:complete
VQKLDRPERNQLLGAYLMFQETVEIEKPIGSACIQDRRGIKGLKRV